MRRFLDAVLGVGYLAFVVAFVAVAILIYNKSFDDRTEVTLVTSVMGNALQEGSDVKLRGVPVGTISGITPAATETRLTLALEPAVARKLSPATSALLLPKTLFGERYVALQPTSSAVGAGLHSGDVIHQDSSAKAVELQDVFDRLLPVLQSIDPAKLAATMGALADMLRGQGREIGDALASWNGYLKKLDPLVGQMTDDFAALGRVADEYADAVPDLLDALDTLTTTAKTLVDKEDDLRNVFASVTGTSDVSDAWLSDSRDTIRILTNRGRAALDAVAPYASEFPCLFQAAAGFVPVMEKNLGKGTDAPGLHAVVQVAPRRSPYKQGENVYTHTPKDAAPSCPYVTGKTGTRSTGPRAIGAPPGGVPATEAVDGSEQAATGLGPANSPEENEMIAELMTAASGKPPASYPKWSSLLLGPALRGTEVEVK